MTITEQQIWFLLIFSVPFVPALVVFFIIKPQSGNAKLGGSLPLFKDLTVELSGAIATYVTIVILAIIAYKMITETSAIVLKIRPVISLAESTETSPHDFNNLSPPNLTLTIKRTNGVIVKRSYSFKLSPNGRSYLLESPLYLNIDNVAEATIVFHDNKSFVTTPPVNVDFHQKEITLEMLVRDEYVSDWVADLHAVRCDYDIANRAKKTRQFFIVSTRALHPARKIIFGTISVPELKSVRVSVFRISHQASQYFFDTLKQVLAQKSGVDAQTTKLEDELISQSTQVGDAAEWNSRESFSPFVVPNNDQAAKIIVAPSPRIDLPLEEAPEDNRFIVVVESSGLMGKSELETPEALTVGYILPTELAITAVVLQSGARFCGPRTEIAVDTPTGRRLVDAENSIQRSDAKIAWATDLSRSSEMVVHSPWRLQACD